MAQAEDNGHVWVHNNKQGFQDCEVYAELEKWLGERSDKYLDEHVDKVELVLPHYTGLVLTLFVVATSSFPHPNLDFILNGLL